ncbi:MAG TPA: PilZ domain-containing protein [Verrucomicrobiae bacterium]|nr:PilZ domain-containing protein [Verrucomicrobiae bacterium]
MDLRKAKRYPMSAAVSFCWDPGNGILQEGQGTTLDVSSRGVFVITESAPRVGGQLELEVYLKSPSPESKLVRFHGEGKVVRTSKKGRESGFAAEVLFQSEGPDSPFSEYGDRIQ